jgi:hypothetical protein
VRKKCTTPFRAFTSGSTKWPKGYLLSHVAKKMHPIWLAKVANKLLSSYLLSTVAQQCTSYINKKKSLFSLSNKK